MGRQLRAVMMESPLLIALLRHYEKPFSSMLSIPIELNGEDLRREPFVVRKRTVASLLGDETVTGLLGS
jgi:hypothetical protein